MNVDRSRSRSAPDPERLLTLYLNDHLAGAGGGRALARRTARAQRGTPAGPRLAALAEEIAEDRESLLEVMTALDVPVMRTKDVMVRLAERAGRVKPNGRLLTRSPLSDLLELEALKLGVEGKLALWRALRNLAEADARLDPVAMGRLAARAERQARVLEDLRMAVVDRTLVPAAGPARRTARGVLGTAGWAS
ncbi:hypothetical protein [Streptomyces sp. WAC06614]|uniref:hypothetical protein n=1 Tax=Streptomyces sp. WAC06614 TaxID=2487416 RepID=UPI001C8E70F5|nr:hypothetical protein [Streptomyces sp. WAC06614]